MFIASMPSCKKMYAPLSELCKKITEFIFDWHLIFLVI
jgi:hypothetical protein